MCVDKFKQIIFSHIFINLHFSHLGHWYKQDVIT